MYKLISIKNSSYYLAEGKQDGAHFKRECPYLNLNFYQPSQPPERMNKWRLVRARTDRKDAYLKNRYRFLLALFPPLLSPHWYRLLSLENVCHQVGKIVNDNDIVKRAKQSDFGTAGSWNASYLFLYTVLQPSSGAPPRKAKLTLQRPEKETDSDMVTSIKSVKIGEISTSL